MYCRARHALVTKLESRMATSAARIVEVVRWRLEEDDGPVGEAMTYAALTARCSGEGCPSCSSSLECC